MPARIKSDSLRAVLKMARSRRITVCLLSSHPLVYAEFQRLLPPGGFRLLFRRLGSTLAPELRRLRVPRAQLYLVDASAPRLATEALIENILDRFPRARVLVVAEKHTESSSFSHLRLGAKGLLTYAEARRKLRRALPLVAAGGFWVPRSILSRFVDSILSDSRGRRLKAGAPAGLSQRQREVLDCLLQNLSNKEISNRLPISERTVKFHVSNLLAKFGVRRRTDLILVCYQRKSSVG